MWCRLSAGNWAAKSERFKYKREYVKKVLIFGAARICEFTDVRRLFAVCGEGKERTKEGKKSKRGRTVTLADPVDGVL